MAVIDSDKFIIHLVCGGLVDKATCGELREAIELSTVKDVYSKADVINMLTELQKEIEKLETPKSYQNEYTNAYLGAMAMKEKDKCIIQQKINELNEVCDDK